MAISGSSGARGSFSVDFEPFKAGFDDNEQFYVAERKPCSKIVKPVRKQPGGGKGRPLIGRRGKSSSTRP